MARRKKEEVLEEIIEEVKEVEPVEIEQPKIDGVAKKATKKKSTVKITAPRVNIRKSPSLVGEVQKIAVAGDKFNLINDSNDGFYEIICDNSNAYVMKEFAELA